MSDEIEIGTPGQPRRREVIRTLAPREAHERTVADVASAGVASDIGDSAARAEPAREISLPETLTRRRRDERQVGGFVLPANRKKPGWDYQWIPIRVLNQPVDSSEIRDFREGGWRPSRAADWPELVEPGTSDDAPIESLGQRLYTRPLSLTHEAQAEDLQYAQRQQRDRMVAAASGKSAVRGEEGMPAGRAVRTVPIEVSLEGLAG